MTILDVSIVNVALPSIGTSLHFSQDNLQWVITAYAITYGGFLLLAGRLADLYGRRRVFMIGVVIFTVASLFCGLAWSESVLIAWPDPRGPARKTRSAIACSSGITRSIASSSPATINVIRRVSPPAASGRVTGESSRIKPRSASSLPSSRVPYGSEELVSTTIVPGLSRDATRSSPSSTSRTT